ncbi:MAG: phospholipid carrier-dependent glycosyltransferase, partial [Candidatus Binatia bacterium]
YLARRLSSIYGLLGFFFFIFTPAILRLSHWAYVDLGVTFYSTASLLCLLRWMEATEDKRWLILAGLSAGFAIATKPNGLLVFLLLFFLLVIIMERGERRNRMETAGAITLFLIMVFIPVSPWFLKNLIWTGNPLFPFFLNLFGGGGEAGGEPGLGIFARRELLYGETLWQIIALPLRVFFSGQDDQPQFFDGVLNPILILFLPWSFKGKWVEEKRILFGFALFYFLYAFFLTELRIRYILPIVPPLVVLLVYGIHNVYLRVVHPSFLFTVVIFLLALNGVYLWNYFHAVSPMDYLKGGESREAYLTRMLPDYPALQYINQNLPDTARVYFIFMGRRVYYCERDYFYDAGDNASFLLDMIQKAQNQDEIKIRLQEKGLTHLLIREDLFKRFLANNLTADQWEIWGSFANIHLRGLYRARGYSLFQIHGSPL